MALQDTINDFIADAAALALLVNVYNTWGEAHETAAPVSTTGSLTFDEFGFDAVGELNNGVFLNAGSPKLLEIPSGAGGTYEVSVFGAIQDAVGDNESRIGCYINGVAPTVSGRDYVRVEAGVDRETFSHKRFVVLSGGDTVGFGLAQTTSRASSTTIDYNVLIRRIK